MASSLALDNSKAGRSNCILAKVTVSREGEGMQGRRWVGPAQSSHWIKIEGWLVHRPINSLYYVVP